MSFSKENEQRAYWRQLWATAGGWEQRDVWYALDEVKFDHLRRFLPPSGRSLEVGCGSARLSRFLSALGFDVVGLDYEETALSLAQQRFQEDVTSGGLLLGDAFALPFAAESFDVVLSTGLLEHFADPSPIVREMTRVLRRGGLFYSDIVPKKFSLLRMFSFFSRSRCGAWERFLNKAQIAAMMKDAGLTSSTVFAAGVLFPTLPLVWRWQPLARLHTKTSLLSCKMARRLDGSKAAEALGVYYSACARKLGQQFNVIDSRTERAA